MQRGAVAPLILLTASVLISGGCGNEQSPSEPPVVGRLDPVGTPPTGIPGRPIPVNVRVVDTRGSPFPGETVSFTVVSGDGTVAPASSVSASNGIALAQWVPGLHKGRQELAASAGGITLTIHIDVTGGGFQDMEVVSGQGAEAPVGWPLPEPVTARFTDVFGDPVAGVAVEWTIQTGDGALASSDTVSDADGLATAVWRLGPEVGAQRLAVRASQGGTTSTTEILATAFDGIRVRTEPPLMYQDRTAHTTLEAWGGQSETYVWSVSDGTLPAGVALSSTGVLAGSPTTEGRFPLTITVRDGDGANGDWTGDLVVCGSKAIILSLGESYARTFPDPCGMILPDDGDAVYRLGLMARAREASEFGEVAGGFLIRGRRFEDVAAGATIVEPSQRHLAPADVRSIISRSRGLDTGVPDVVGLDLLNRLPDKLRRLERDTRQRAPGMSAEDLPESRTFRVLDPAGTVVAVTAALRATSEHLAFYEDDENTADGGARLTDDEIRLALERYERFGQPVIDEVFGGFGPDGTVGLFKDAQGNVVQVPPGDIDGNGRVLLVQVRPSVMGRRVGFVSLCDRLPLPAHAVDPDLACEESNEGEIVYHRSGSPYTYVHELRHVASHGHFLANPDLVLLRESWVEEGTAVMASELLGRRAAGIAPGHRVTAADVYVEGGLPSWETYYTWVAPLLGYEYLAASPLSGLVGTPVPNPNGASIYGSGWLFHRYLVDRFAGGDPVPFLFSFLKTGGGLRDTETQLGVPWRDLLVGFMSAILVEDVPEARANTQNRFLSYDFRDIIDSEPRPEYQEGHWPALLADEPFGKFDWSIETWRTATNAFQLTADGGGALLVNVFDGAGDPVDPAEDAVLVVVRVR